MAIRSEAGKRMGRWLALWGAVLTSVCSTCQGDAVPDECDPYDCDGDGISTAVEADSINRAVNDFDTSTFNFDDSRAGGLPDSNGHLVFGIHLPDTQNFSTPWGHNGYYHHFGSDTTPRHDDDWGTLALVSMIEKTGRFWRTHDCPAVNQTRRIGILDLSRREGGVFYSQANPLLREHISHQNGLDVDVRYVRTSGAETPLSFPNDVAAFDSGGTQRLMECFKRRGSVVRIFVDTVYVKIWFPGITVHDSTHRNHFHVRIRDPEGTNN